MWRRHLTTFSEAVSAYEEPQHIVGLPDKYTNLISQFHLEVTTRDMKSTSWLLETKAQMTFHLAPSNPLIITAAAEAQRLHLCCISGCHGKKKRKKKNPPSHIHSVQTERKQSFYLRKFKVWESKTLKTSDSSSHMCVCVCVLGYKKNPTGIFLDASQTAAAKISIYRHNHYEQWRSCFFFFFF